MYIVKGVMASQTLVRNGPCPYPPNGPVPQS